MKYLIVLLLYITINVTTLSTDLSKLEYSYVVIGTKKSGMIYSTLVDYMKFTAVGYYISKSYGLRMKYNDKKIDEILNKADVTQFLIGEVTGTYYDRNVFWGYEIYIPKIDKRYMFKLKEVKNRYKINKMYIGEYSQKDKRVITREVGNNLMDFYYRMGIKTLLRLDNMRRSDEY